MARITTTHRISGKDHEPVTARELRDFLEGLPDGTTIAVEPAPDSSAWQLTASELPRPAKQQLNPPGTRAAASLPATMGPDVPPTPVWAQEGFTKGS